MNPIYVTVSIPLLLVLAGFNHAHGLTTFGKSNTNQQGPAIPDAQPKHCTHQIDCNFIKSTTCLKGYCLCGDNTHPINGACSAQYKGPRHLCSTDEDCVVGADCKLPVAPKDTSDKKNKPGLQGPVNSVCTCQEGLVEYPNSAICSGAEHTHAAIIPGFLLLILALLLKSVD